MNGEGYSYCSTKSGPSARGDGWSDSRPGRFNSVRSQLPIVQVATYAPRAGVSKGEEEKISFPTGIRKPQLPNL
jgi:hypothetical protein